VRSLRMPAFVVACFMATVVTAQTALDTARIEKLTGAKGQMNAGEGVFKVTLPRSDLKVTAMGVKLNPATGLGCWAAFKKMGDHTMMMGDQCLTEDQVNPVMSVALENGLEVTALHNHFAGDSPRVMFMHIGGSGDEAGLAAAVGKVFETIKRTAAARPAVAQADIDASKSRVDGKKISEILGTKREDNKGVYKVTIGRTTKMHGQDIGAAMGVNTWAAFAGSDEKAVVDGDFAMTEKELQAVLKALRGHDISVVAIHNHMTSENPRIIFLHYWGVGTTEQLARSLKAALDAQKEAGHSASESAVH
jgi:uncharacterized protein DUF1259